MFAIELWPLPQFLQTLASPDLRYRFFPFRAEPPASVLAIRFVLLVLVDASKSMTTGEKVVALKIRRPDLDCAGSGVKVSDSSVSSLMTTSSSLCALFLLLPLPDPPVGRALGRPPARALAPPRPRAVPLGVTLLELPSVGLVFVSSWGSVLMIDFLPPLPLLPPVFALALGTVAGVMIS